MEDIPLLVRHLLQLEALTNPALAARFVRAGAGGRPEVDVAAALILVLLRWPHDGNLRDLRNLLLRAMTETAGPSLMPPVDRLRRLPPPATEDIEDVQQLLDGIRSPNEVIMQSKELLHPHMVRHGWQLQKAAKAVGIDRHALARLLEKHGIRRPGGD
jgi:DNA-binding NtrC family response regulator